MKKYLGISLVLGVTFIAGRWSLEICQQLDVHALEEKCAGTNGDVNADGLTDVSDAITLLSNLFLGDPSELVRLCDPPELLAELADCTTALETAAAGLSICNTDLESMEAVAAAQAERIQELEDQLNECRGPIGRPLPDTGQTICTDDRGDVIACDEISCLGQDGFYSTGCPTEGRFVDNGDGTVTDTCTGLMWQRRTADTNADGTFGDADDALTWCQALTYCDDLVFAEYSDWRLPNIRELESIFYYGGGLSTDPLLQVSQRVHWSSTTVASDHGAAWDGIIKRGTGIGIAKFRAHRVLAVRTGGSSVSAGESLPDTGQVTCRGVDGVEIPCDADTCSGQDGFYSTGCPSEGRFVDNEDGTVTDTCTGLMWQRETADTNADGMGNESDVLQWCDAVVYCEDLTFAGHDDWRMPNARELQSIVDYGRAAPAIDPVFGLSSQSHWSSTSFQSDRSKILYDFFRGGRTRISSGLDDFGVLAVRTTP